MYAEIAWVLVSWRTQVQPEVIADADYLPDYLYVFMTIAITTFVSFNKCCKSIKRNCQNKMR